MKEIICTTQAELDAVPVDFDGSVIIKFGAPHMRAVVNRRFRHPVVAWNDSYVEAYGDSEVVAYGNGEVVAYGNSSVEACNNRVVVARGNSSVIARGNSSVEAWDDSSVEAWDDSSVEARNCCCVVARDHSSVDVRHNSTIEAHDNSSVEVYDNSSGVARGNSQVVDVARKGYVEVGGNARIVYIPSDVDEYIDYYRLDANDTTVKLHKAVHSYGGAYHADFNHKFVYTVGGVVTPDDRYDSCASATYRAGLALAHKAWAVDYGKNWPDLAILECECEKADVLALLGRNSYVKVRKAKVLREVPLEECGLYGKMLAKRRASAAKINACEIGR